MYRLLRHSLPFQDTFTLRRPGVAIFAYIIKIATMTENKWKELEIMYQYAIYICISWYSKIVDFRWKNTDVSRTQRVCHVIQLFFGSSLGKV